MTESRTASRGLVLVVEDDIVAGSTIQYNLEDRGFEVLTAHDGQEAQRIAQEHVFDAIVTDQRMPGMNGLQLIRQLRSEPAHANTPIFLVTAAAMEVDAEQLEQLRISALLQKPFSPRVLVRQVQAAIEARRRD